MKLFLEDINTPLELSHSITALYQQDFNLSDELLALRHKKALELLNKPGQRESFEEWTKNSINITALKEWEEAGYLQKSQHIENFIFELLEYLKYKKNEACKDGTNSESVGEHKPRNIWDLLQQG
ncbi:22939_t:CDS:2 [Entrophospora sp. SA101]|nr:22939_t:CDS:2 [Entrophospora sp. SA101]